MTSYRADKQVIDTHTQTQAATIPGGQNWPRVKRGNKISAEKMIHGHMTEYKCGYQLHIFVNYFSWQHAPMWRCLCSLQPLQMSVILRQMHQQNPADAPSKSRDTTRIRFTPTEPCLHF